MKTHDILLICIILILGTSFIYVRDIWKATYQPFHEQQLRNEIEEEIEDVKDKPKDKPKQKPSIHAADSVRIKQYVEVYHLLYGTYQVHTEVWCTYKNVLYCEKSIYDTVYKDKIDSTKRAQFNKVLPYYQKLQEAVKNRLLNP